MSNFNATKQASLAGARVLILKGLFEILDTRATYDIKWNTPEWDKAHKQLLALEEKLDIAEGEEILFWGLSLAEDEAQEDAADFAREPRD